MSTVGARVALYLSLVHGACREKRGFYRPLPTLSDTPTLFPAGADPDGTMFPMGHGCLFNVIDDPAELRNLAAEPAHAATVARLRALIAAEQVLFSIQYNSRPPLASPHPASLPLRARHFQATVFNPRRGTANQTLLCNAAYNPAGAGNGFGPYHGFLGPFLP